MTLIRLNDFPAVIRGTIINQNQFNIPESLVDDRLNPFPEVGAVIIVWYDDSDLRHPGLFKQGFDPFKGRQQAMTHPVSQRLPEHFLLVIQRCLQNGISIKQTIVYFG